MKILFVGMRWDYKDPRRGDSFEYVNFFRTLNAMPGIDADLFPFDVVESRVGRLQMNKNLVEQVRDETYDLVFFFLFEEEFHPATVDDISAETTTLNWFADDHWRFHTFSKKWAPHFTFVATTDNRAWLEYRQRGISQPILTQWGCNHRMYGPRDVRRDIDISFVGEARPLRRRAVRTLEQAGYRCAVWGRGWPSGPLPPEEMIRVFSRTMINLNFADSSPATGLRGLRFLVRPHGRFTPTPAALRDNLRAIQMKRRGQIKARNFEIAGCRTFLLTSAIEGLSDYFDIGKEIEQFESPDDLVDKCRSYISDHDRRERVATGGYERVMREHTYEKRFRDIFAVVTSG